MTSYYQEKLKEGVEYQDYLISKLLQFGIIIIPYSSKKYQINKGESLTMHEIKFDNKMNETGNIYIELYEKSDPGNSTWINSGVLRNDNTIFFIIGNYEKAFLFHKKILKILVKSNKYRKVETPTSQGVLIPIDKAIKYSTYINFKENTIQ